MSEQQPHANLVVPAFKTEKDPKTQTQNGQSIVWRFGGSDKAAKASTVTLRGVIYMLFDNCSKDINKTILPLGHGDPSVYPCFRTSIEAEDAVVDVLRSGKANSYGPGAGILPARRAVADYLNRDLPNKLTPDDIFLTAGCNQGIEIVFESLARPNANILLPRPGFPHYDARAAYSGLEVRKFDLLPDKEWEIDLQGIEAIADENTVAVVVINPNNPCGNVYSHDHLKKAAETARKLGIMVISDEVYDKTIFGDNPFVPMGKFASIVPVLTLAGISKGWVVPGWKIGWIALNDPDRIFETTKVVQSIKQNLDVTPDPATIIQAALPAILEKADKNFFAKKNKILKHNVDLVCDRLKDIPCVVCPKKPESCTYLLATRMKKTVNIHFKFEGCMYSMVLKQSTEEITLAMVEERLYKKLALDESKVKFQLSYNPLLVGCEDISIIKDDEELYVFLTSIDHLKRSCILFVEVITNSGLPEQQSKAVKSSCGKNYGKSSDGEIGPNAITLYVGKEQQKEQIELIEEDDGDENEKSKEGGSVSSDEATKEVGIVASDEGMDRGMDISDMGDEYVEPPPLPIVQHVQAKDPWEDGLGLSKLQEFPNKKKLLDVVGKGAFVNSFGFVNKKSDPGRLVLTCNKAGCKWRIRGSRVAKTEIFAIKRYNKMHTCSRASKSTSSSNIIRHGTPELVAGLLQKLFPGQMETPCPKVIMDLVQTKLGVSVSYSTALRGKNKAVENLRGSPEESYKMLYCYLHMLEKANLGTVTRVKLDENGKFKYLFIALGASVEGFQEMRKVLIMDATFIKNGYGGVLVFASAQDPNRHIYPIAFGVLDGENDASWFWFLEMLKIVVRDSSAIVFMTDRNQSLIKAVGMVYPRAHHGYCVWHLSQNVKGHASNVNRDVVAYRFMQCSKHYTEVDFKADYEIFEIRYPSVAEYVKRTCPKEKWARYCFPGERYNLDTSNCVESLNKVFKEERNYSLIPLLDAVIKKLAVWFDEHRQEAAAGSINNKMVPLVENWCHDAWGVAEKLNVTALNTFDLEYNVIDSDGIHFLVKLRKRSCSCRVFDIEKYPCLHGLAAYIQFHLHDDRFELHQLCSQYYWTETWTKAYYRTIYLVPHKDHWDVPEDIKSKQIIPPDPKKKKGRRRVTRWPSAGEKGKRPRTQNKRRPRQRLQWILFGERFAV